MRVSLCRAQASPTPVAPAANLSPVLCYCRLLRGCGHRCHTRAWLQEFRLPGEAQMIDRLMNAFSAKYCQCNPSVRASAVLSIRCAAGVVTRYLSYAPHSVMRVRF